MPGTQSCIRPEAILVELFEVAAPSHGRFSWNQGALLGQIHQTSGVHLLYYPGWFSPVVFLIADQNAGLEGVSRPREASPKGLALTPLRRPGIEFPRKENDCDCWFVAESLQKTPFQVLSILVCRRLF